MKKDKNYFFTYVKKKLKVSDKIGPFVDKKGKVIDKPITDQLNEQYADMWSDPLPDKAVTNPTEFFNEECDGPSLRSVIFTSERVINAINKLDGEASAGTRWNSFHYNKEFKGNIGGTYR